MNTLVWKLKFKKLKINITPPFSKVFAEEGGQVKTTHFAMNQRDGTLYLLNFVEELKALSLWHFIRKTFLLRLAYVISLLFLFLSLFLGLLSLSLFLMTSFVKLNVQFVGLLVIVLLGHKEIVVNQLGKRSFHFVQFGGGETSCVGQKPSDVPIDDYVLGLTEEFGC